MDGGFTSTRGSGSVPLSTALFTALAADGGLFVPESVPTLPWSPGTPPTPESPSDLRPLARWASPHLFPSVDPATLDDVVDEAFDFPVPVVEVEPGIWVLELFHGPTHAFKDVGARFMAALMEAVDGSDGDRRDATRTILVATSGDTGGAVASAFHGRRRYRVVVLFPRDGISDRQRRQMTTLGGNVRAVAVEGTFDDCQRLVKEAFRDRALSERHRLTSANSINVGRLLPQAFYYLHAARLVPLPHFVVPAGNLGNLCAGLLAWRAGMAAEGFTAATNENRGFADYLEGEVFVAKPSLPTTSSAMDVGDPSNLERIRWLFGGDDGQVRSAVRGATVSQPEVARCITELHARTGYVADPHTAVAYAAARRHNGSHQGPLVVLATAHPAKFPETVEQAIGDVVDMPRRLRDLQDRDEMVSTMPPDLSSLTKILGESNE